MSMNDQRGSCNSGVGIQIDDDGHDAASVSSAGASVSVLLDQLVQTRFTLSSNASSVRPLHHESNITDNRYTSSQLPLDVDLWALPEQDFHRLTSSANKHSDGTGMRPYSGAWAFLQFVRSFPEVFLSYSSLVDLGAGIGACGLLLAQLQQRHQVKTAGEESALPLILVTDGEDLAVETIKRNRKLLGLGPENVKVCKLLWSHDPKQVSRQLVEFGLSRNKLDKQQHTTTTEQQTHSRFTYVVGTDLLYYRCDATVLVATAAALLDSSSLDGEGAIFLPAIIRSWDLGHDIVQSAEEHGLQAFTIRLVRFVPLADLELIAGWYNLNFLVLIRKKATLQSALKSALESCKLKLFDPDASSSDEEDEDEE